MTKGTLFTCRCIPSRSGPTVAEAFIKEGKAAGKASKKRKAPKGYSYVDDEGDDVDLMPPPPAPGKVNCRNLISTT